MLSARWTRAVPARRAQPYPLRATSHSSRPDETGRTPWAWARRWPGRGFLSTTLEVKPSTDRKFGMRQGSGSSIFGINERTPGWYKRYSASRATTRA